MGLRSRVKAPKAAPRVRPPIASLLLMLSSLGPVGFARIASQHAPAFACKHGGFAALSALQHLVGRWLGVRGAHALGTMLGQMLPAATSTSQSADHSRRSAAHRDLRSLEKTRP